MVTVNGSFRPFALAGAMEFHWRGHRAAARGQPASGGQSVYDVLASQRDLDLTSELVGIT